jgi:UDP-glucose 4-epimerase
MTNILVVGGAGYIGSHTCLDLRTKGFTPVVFDDLSNGHQEFVRWGPFEHGDIGDRERIDEVLRSYKPEAIIHFAGLIEVGQSVKAPVAFFQTNVSGSINLISAALKVGIDKLVFSSTCATYGLPQRIPIDESHPQSPINPYGRSKLMVEQMLQDLSLYKGFRSVALRYFNAAGADPEGRVGEWHDPETHAVPLAIDVALGRRPVFQIFGNDFETRDGTCVRDFVHVMDLAEAHSRSIQYLLDGGATTALNLGSGDGTTVLELIQAIETVSGRPLATEFTSRRQGDSPMLVADSRMAGITLDWKPRHKLNSIIETAWRWHSSRSRS